MRRNRAFVTGLLALALVAGGVPSSRADDADKARIAELERSQAEMKAEMRKLRELLEAKQAAAAPTPTSAKVQGQVPASPVESGDRVVEVERKQNVITEEVRKIKEALVLPETQELKSEYGLGPAASKIYNVTRGVSFGGYGEFNYKNTVSDGNGNGDEFDMLRLVVYAGYKFSDRILFNSEVEFEHGTTDKGGEVAVEFANIDVLLHPKINLRGGLVLMPMGFLNEIHEPPFYHGNMRPPVEQQIIPSTWNAGGVGLFGEVLPGLTYRTYLVTGLDASGFTSAGIREGRQEGAFEKAENFGWVGRLDYSPYEMLTIGGSAYVGNSGQGQNFGNPTDGYSSPDVFTQLYEAHAQLRWRGLETRLLGAWSDISDAAALSLDANINPHVVDPSVQDQPVAGKQFGWYGEIAYNVLPLVFPDTGQYLAPWFRYSRIDTQSDVPAGFAADKTEDEDIFEVGLSYKPHPQVVFKLDYRNQQAEVGKLPDMVRIGAGFAY